MTKGSLVAIWALCVVTQPIKGSVKAHAKKIFFAMKCSV